MDVHSCQHAIECVVDRQFHFHWFSPLLQDILRLYGEPLEHVRSKSGKFSEILLRHLEGKDDTILTCRRLCFCLYNRRLDVAPHLLIGEDLNPEPFDTGHLAFHDPVQLVVVLADAQIAFFPLTVDILKSDTLLKNVLRIMVHMCG